MPVIRLKTKAATIWKSKSSWGCVGGRRFYFRSKSEVRVANQLQNLLESKLIKFWEHEPQTFWFLEIKRGVRSYLPDFKVTRLDETHYWIEVKGYMDKKSITKIKRFKKYYPNEELIIYDSEWFLKQKGFI